MNETAMCVLCENRPSSADVEEQLGLNFEIREIDNVTVICCDGRIVYGTEASALFEEAQVLLLQTHQIVIDLGGVEMIDAHGLGRLVSVAVIAKANECSIKLAAPRDFVQRAMKLTNLTSVFDVHPTLKAAVLAFR